MLSKRCAVLCPMPMLLCLLNLPTASVHPAFLHHACGNHVRMIQQKELCVQTVQAGCRRAHMQHYNRPSEETWQLFVNFLSGNHAGYQALLLHLKGPMPRAELLYKQCQLALKAPKVGCSKQAVAQKVVLPNESSQGLS